MTPAGFTPTARQQPGPVRSASRPGAAGTYDVTLTARLANGQTRRGTGRLTVSGGGTAPCGPKRGLRPGSADHGTAERLSVRIARRLGIAVLICANTPGRRVRLFQVAAQAEGDEGVRLQVPGPPAWC